MWRASGPPWTTCPAGWATGRGRDRTLDRALPPGQPATIKKVTVAVSSWKDGCGVGTQQIRRSSVYSVP